MLRLMCALMCLVTILSCSNSEIPGILDDAGTAAQLINPAEPVWFDNPFDAILAATKQIFAMDGGRDVLAIAISDDSPADKVVKFTALPDSDAKRMLIELYADNIDFIELLGTLYNKYPVSQGAQPKPKPKKPKKPGLIEGPTIPPSN